MSVCFGAIRIGGVHGSENIAQLQLLVHAHGHAQVSRLGVDSAKEAGPFGVAHDWIAGHQTNGPGNVAGFIIGVCWLAQGAAQGEITGREWIFRLLLLQGDSQVFVRLVGEEAREAALR